VVGKFLTREDVATPPEFLTDHVEQVEDKPGAQEMPAALEWLTQESAGVTQELGDCLGERGGWDEGIHRVGGREV